MYWLNDSSGIPSLVLIFIYIFLWLKNLYTRINIAITGHVVPIDSHATPSSLGPDPSRLTGKPKQ